jgi:transposase-like protein
MEHLRRAIGDPSLLAVSSDAYEGLENAIKIVFPHTEQRECFRHLMENYVKRYGGAENMYPAARAYRRLSMSITRQLSEARKMSLIG